MRVLVTGATGMIGRRLVPALSARGISVRAAVRQGALEGVESMEIGDLRGGPPWGEALAGIEGVVHLAAMANPSDPAARRDPSLFHQVNVQASENLARAAVAAGVGRFIFMSSIMVHGVGGGALTATSPLGPQNAYGESKRDAEAALNRVLAPSNTVLTILRSPPVYGPGVSANFLSLVKLAASGVPLPLASVDNRLSLMYVENLTDAVAQILAKGGTESGGTYLVSDGQDVSTADLIRRLARALNVRSRLFPFPPGLLRTAANLTGQGRAAARLLGTLTADATEFRRQYSWKPPHTLDEGLAATAAWYRGNQQR